MPSAMNFFVLYQSRSDWYLGILHTMHFLETDLCFGPLTSSVVLLWMYNVGTLKTLLSAVQTVIAYILFLIQLTRSKTHLLGGMAEGAVAG